MSPVWIKRLLTAACVLTLAGLALMVWSVVDPSVVPVMLAMMAGQGLGTVALLLFLFVVIMDLRKAKVFEDKEHKP
jgi:hypothetical protein